MLRFMLCFSMKSKKTPHSNPRMAKYRAKMQEKGYKQIQLWVPDINSPEFKKLLKKEQAAIKKSNAERETADWLEEATKDAFSDL
jgi:hypothetical protein